MYLLTIYLPLCSAIICGLTSFIIGRKGAIILSITNIVITFLIALKAFYDIGLKHTVYTIKTITWINSFNLHVDWGFLFDSLTVTMLVVVTAISTAVHIYSASYMEEDPHLPRFMSYLSLFTFLC